MPHGSLAIPQAATVVYPALPPQEGHVGLHHVLQVGAQEVPVPYVLLQRPEEGLERAQEGHVGS
jgi:hypothetical protein